METVRQTRRLTRTRAGCRAWAGRRTHAWSLSRPLVAGMRHGQFGITLGDHLRSQRIQTRSYTWPAPLNPCPCITHEAVAAQLAVFGFNYGVIRHASCFAV